MAKIEDVIAQIRLQKPQATAMTLYKLAYYAQAWHATWEGRPLFESRIEAWAHGPVPRAGWDAEKQGRRGDASGLTSDEKEVVNSVIEFYGRFSAAQLRALTHREEPWQAARGDLPESANCDAEIPVSAMRRFYTRKTLRDQNVPQRKPSRREINADAARAIASHQMNKWSDTLDWLATR